LELRDILYSAVLKIKSIALHGAETWILRKIDQKHLESFEIWCWRRTENISRTILVKNEVLHRAKEERNILCTIKRRKTAWMVTPCVGTAFQNTLLKDKRTRMKTYVTVGSP
jgi:hypothetical protein